MLSTVVKSQLMHDVVAFAIARSHIAIDAEFNTGVRSTYRKLTETPLPDLNGGTVIRLIMASSIMELYRVIECSAEWKAAVRLCKLWIEPGASISGNS